MNPLKIADNFFQSSVDQVCVALQRSGLRRSVMLLTLYLITTISGDMVAAIVFAQGKIDSFTFTISLLLSAYWIWLGSQNYQAERDTEDHLIEIGLARNNRAGANLVTHLIKAVAFGAIIHTFFIPTWDSPFWVIGGSALVLFCYVITSPFEPPVPPEKLGELAPERC